MNQTSVQFLAAEDEKLVEVISSYSCIYDSESPKYKNQSVKDNAWVEIADYVERSGKKQLYRTVRSNIRGFALTLYLKCDVYGWRNVCIPSILLQFLSITIIIKAGVMAMLFMFSYNLISLLF